MDKISQINLTKLRTITKQVKKVLTLLKYTHSQFKITRREQAGFRQLRAPGKMI